VGSGNYLTVLERYELVCKDVGKQEEWYEYFKHLMRLLLIKKVRHNSTKINLQRVTYKFK
jgi:hypothetical protein